MPTVTVLAPDSALAMDEVIRQLGENAYIVATNARNGQVEILATNEPAQQQAQRKRATTVSFADAISERLGQASHATVKTKRDDLIVPAFPAESTANEIEDLEMSTPAASDAEQSEIDTQMGDGSRKVQPVVAHNSTATEADLPAEYVDVSILTNGQNGRTVQAAKQMHESSKSTIADLAAKDNEDLRSIMRDFAAQLVRLEERMGSALQMGLTMPPLTDSIAIAGFSDKIISHLAPTVGTSERAQTFTAALTQKLVVPNPLAILSGRLLVVVGASGVGKSTLAGKIAALTRATDPVRNIALISVTEALDFDRTPLAAHAQALAIEHGHLDANQLDTADFATPNTTHILDNDLEPETLVRMLGPLRDQMTQGELIVILAIPAGASLARLSGELKKYESLAPVLAFTKLDEYEISAQEVSQIAEDGMQIAMVSGTCELNGTLAPVTDEMISEFLMGLLAVQP